MPRGLFYLAAVTSTLRNALLVAGLFAVVVAASIFYSRAIRQSPAIETAETTPAALESAFLHAGIQDGLRAVQDTRLEDARTSFESVPSSDPGYLIARQNLVAVLVRSGDLAGAATVLQEIAALQPDNPSIAEHLAWAYYGLADYERAELYALRGLEIDGRLTHLRYAVGLFRLASGRTIEAIPAYKRAMEADTKRTHVTEALTRLMTLGQERPELSAVHYTLAFFANALRRKELEIQELEKYLAAEPTGPIADTARARLAEARGTALPASPSSGS